MNGTVYTLLHLRQRWTLQVRLDVSSYTLEHGDNGFI